MTHLAAATFFIVVLLAAAVAIHMTVRLYWDQIVAALRGELGREIKRSVPRGRRAPAYARRAAF